ncbi:survival protein sure-like phosphatase/nucleotidase [Delphinella strobiligena]|nr:survival protein sure-like phosphatase/nucleotidase [Delphinella strobiligena]
MHILVTNDDGPPSEHSSPYVLPFTLSLEAAGHTVSVILPDNQRSWIGKAHLVGKDVKAEYYWPATGEHETPSTGSSPDAQKGYPWVLINSTPASCSQLGLNHFFKDRPPIDLVVSGPNYGRNTTAVFALSSGTMGAALEASVSGYKAIAVSFAFFDRLNDPEIVAQSCRHSVKVVEWLAKNGEWDAGRIFTVNVPVKDGVESQPTVWTKILQNAWTSGSCFEERPSDVSSPDIAEERLRSQESRDGQGPEGGADDDKASDDKWKTRHFKWAPSFKDVFESVRKSGPGNDGWAVSQGQTSITALRANFMHIEGFQGEVKL